MPNTIIASQLAVDPPLTMDANYKFGRADRRYVDDQIRAIEQLLVDALISGHHGSYYDLDGASDPVIAGDTVCLASSSDGTVTKALTGPLADAGAPLGVVIVAASPGGKVFVAFGGTVPPSITGLPSGSPGFAKVDDSTGRLEYDAAAVGYTIGTLDNAGWLQISVRISAYGVTSSGGNTDEIQISDGASGFTGATNVRAGNGFIEIGAAPVASAGDMRHAANTKVLMTRDIGDTKDLCVVGTDGSDNLIIGGSSPVSNADAYSQVFINPANFGYLYAGGSAAVRWTAGDFRVYVPIVFGSTEASQGTLRFTSGNSKSFVRNNTDTDDLCIWDLDETSDRLQIGVDRNQLFPVSAVGIYAASAVYLGIGGSTKLEILSSSFAIRTPTLDHYGTTSTVKSNRENDLNTTDNTSHAVLTLDVTGTPDAGIFLEVTVLGVETAAASLHWFTKKKAWINTAGVLTAGVQQNILDEAVGIAPAGTWAVSLDDDALQGILVNVNSDNDNVTWYVVSQTLTTVPV